MRILVLCLALAGLNSCNTTIGIYRDAKIGFLWTKEKIQGWSGGSGGEAYETEYGAPIY